MGKLQQAPEADGRWKQREMAIRGLSHLPQSVMSTGRSAADAIKTLRNRSLKQRPANKTSSPSDQLLAHPKQLH